MKKSLILLCALGSLQAVSQNVGIGTNNPLSKLHVAGTIRSDTLVYVGPGVRTLFATPNGRIYDSLVPAAALSWEINGNANVTAAHFLGTTNANDVIFKTNNVERARILSMGNMGVGIPTPTANVHIYAANGFAGTALPLRSALTVEVPSQSSNGYSIIKGSGGTTLNAGTVYGLNLDLNPQGLSAGTQYGVYVTNETKNYFSNSVGVGTSNPANRVEITAATANASGLRFTNLTAASPTVAANGKALSVDANGDVVLMPSASDAWKLLGNAGTTAGTNFLGTTDAQDLVIKTNNTERARVLSTGNVGIGTATPGQMLHVNGNTLSNEFWIFSGAGDLKIHNAGIANTMVFNTSALERMRIDNNGLVGINTTTPGKRLEVGAIGGDGISIKATAGVDVGDLMFFDAAGVEKGRVYTNPLAAPGLILSGSSTPAAHVFIDNAGNVGIGNSTPANRVHITSAAANTSGLRFTNLTAASPTVASTGKVLSVDVNGDVVLTPGAANAWELLGNAGTTAGTNFLGTTDAQDLVFKTANTEKARITTTGRLGIATSTPREFLEIANAPGSTGHNLALATQGEATYWSLMKRPSSYANPNNFHIAYFDGTNWNQYMDIMPNGNVGIGNTMPAASAKVEIASTVSGFAMPRMTSVQRRAIAAPIAGLQVYDTDLKGFYVFDGTKWDCANNPAGTVQYFANTTAPNGYLECNGQAVSRTVYAELFAAIGTTYGVGNGTTTFNVPDLRGEFVRGADNGRGADPGRVLGTAQSPSPVIHDDTGGVGAQNGDFSMDNAAAGYSDPWPGTLAGGIPNAYWANSPAGGWTVYTGTNTGGAAYGMISAARPRNVALMPCIKF